MKHTYLFKRLLSAFAVFMLCSFSWAWEQEQEDYETGFVYDLKYDTRTDTYSATITGYFDEWCLTHYSIGDDGELEIPEVYHDTRDNIDYPVVAIDANAFKGCDLFTSVKIPSTMTRIGDYAFSGSALTSVSIPENVKYWGEYVFSDCSSLTSVSISEGATIGMYAFSGSALTSVSIPGSVTEIGNYAFQNCTSLTYVSLSEGVKQIGEHAFENCSSLTSVSIPESMFVIGEYAFSGCSSLTSVSFINSSWYIGESSTYIHDYAFTGCSSLTSIISKLPANSYGNFQSVYSNAFDDVDKEIPLYVPKDLVDTYRKGDPWKYFSNILPIDGGIEVSVGSDGLATYCPHVGVDFSKAEKIAAYRATVNDNTVTLTKADKVNAGEGVLLRSLEGGEAKENLPLSLNPVNAENAFVGVSVLSEKTISKTDEEGNTNYVLSNVDGVVGFYWAKEEGTTVAAGKAYLPVKDSSDPSASIKGLTLVFEDGLATGIDIVDFVQEQASDDDTYYTLGGVPVKNPTQKGVYIKGGKKYIIK